MQIPVNNNINNKTMTGLIRLRAWDAEPLPKSFVSQVEANNDACFLPLGPLKYIF